MMQGVGHMAFTLFSLAIGSSFLAGSLALLHFGWRIGRRHVGDRGPASLLGLAAVESAVFALLGLLLAFSVSGGLQRFDERRQLIVQEANAISTAYDRLDLLEPDERTAVKAKLKAYLESRIEIYREPIEFDIVNERAIYAKEAAERTAALQADLWSAAVAACPNAAYKTTCSILLPNISAIFEIALQRWSANEKHPPAIIFVMLFGLGLVGSLLAGFGMAASETQSRIHVLAFAFALAFALFVVTNLEFPRLGFIRVNMFDHFLFDTLARMK
jgi:hypothetical protein